MFQQMLKFFKNNKDTTNVDYSQNTSEVSNVSIEECLDETKDYSLYSGERQTSNTIDGIRRDHTSRYELAIEIIRQKKHIIINAADIFCGNGYGIFMLSSEFEQANFIGLDGSSEAILEANKNYVKENNIFTNKLFPFTLPVNVFDVITCFESLEHVDKDEQLFDEIKKSCKKDGLIIVSVPNQEKHSLDLNPHKFHFRHYTHLDFLSKFSNGLELLTWYGQDVYQFDEHGINTHQLLNENAMLPVEKVQGQVNIYVFQKR
ncbi:bifunctional 3-demethylubiquinone-9 3-methyltransferase/ 2-octaprenyl-6-hydroxy phenol methylase [Yersinia aldovae]|uniref:class I SAM-dependent methyltransferase n=1 Tax=Yersinia aldovae TaxID=29483 RepID=UPI0005DB2A86|nr:class I SAM-dependent methyltransferase [Yersinia aldovae]CNH03713.1 bifunctional 3-demethylubiquinone-9 3-methyltransferase/ 2-octaprenyl-6-hydroxy phenol methylase [Yersinia aldovae]